MARSFLSRQIAILIALAASCGFAAAQPDEPQKAELGFPQVVFELDWTQADPHWYQVAVDSSGRASYQSQPRVLPDETPGEPYFEKFNMTPKTKARIFDLAAATQDFQGSFDYKGSVRMAQTGIKTLKYEANGKTNSTNFNWSENKQIMELAGIFQDISLTLEIGRQLRHAQRFDKLGVDEILRRLEELQKSNSVVELQAIAPILQRIANDHYSMNIARQRATRLLAVANSAQ